MSYLIRTISYDLKTKESRIINEVECEGEYHGDDMLVRMLAEKLLKDFQKENKQSR